MEEDVGMGYEDGSGRYLGDVTDVNTNMRVRKDSIR